MAVEIGHCLVTIIFFNVIYGNIKTIATWTYPEVLFLVGLNIVSSEIVYGLSFIPNLKFLPQQIKDGEIDGKLLKPINPLFHLSLLKIYLPSLISSLSGVYVMVYAVFHYALHITPLNLLIGILIFCCGHIIAYAILVSATALTFKYINADTLPNMGGQTILSFKINPHQIYEGGVRVLFTFVIPVVFMSSIPAQTMVKGGGVLYLLLSITLAALFLAVAIKFWNIMIRYYASASS
jgi:ABC-2 type transport system permease protein